jgi:hypothetical protein
MMPMTATGSLSECPFFCQIEAEVAITTLVAPDLIRG